MEIFVISLKDSDRRRQLESALESLGLSWRRIDAVDGRHIDEIRLRRIAAPSAGRLLYGQPLTPTQIGCFLSHREAYRQFTEASSEWAVVLEDDAYPLDGASEFLEALSNWHPAGATIVEGFTAGRVNGTHDHNVLAPELGVQRLKTFPGFTVAYAINQAAAELALRAGDIVASRADWPPWAVHVDFWRTVPNAFAHGNLNGVTESTMLVETHSETFIQKSCRWVGLLTGMTYLRLRQSYPQGVGQYYKHAVLPSVFYWQGRLVGRISRRST
jgi:hypothetical protein